MIGHEAIRAELERELPAVTLLLGPPSVGKTTLAAHLATFHRAWLIAVPSLTAAAARDVTASASARYPGGTCYVICLDGSTEIAQNILLKVLEEPPPHARFILTASRLPLPTICSRAVVHRLGMLSEPEVARVLVACYGVADDQAEDAARGHGQVGPALARLARSQRGDESRVRSVVAAALKAARDGGGVTMELALRNWSPEHSEVLRAWAEEASSGRWTWFAESFAPGVTREQARKVVQQLNRYLGSRDAAAVALAAAFREGN